MSTFTYTNTIANGQQADGNKLGQNLTDLRSFVLGHLYHSDGLNAPWKFSTATMTSPSTVVAHNTAYDITWTPASDPNALFSSGTSTITLTAAGIWVISVAILVSTTITAGVLLGVTEPVTATIKSKELVSQNGVNPTTDSLTYVLYATAGQTTKVTVTNDNGAASATITTCAIRVARLGS